VRLRAFVSFPLLLPLAGCWWSVAVETTSHPDRAVSPRDDSAEVIYEGPAVRVDASSRGIYVREIDAPLLIFPLPVPPDDGGDTLCIGINYEALGAGVAVSASEVLVRTPPGQPLRVVWARAASNAVAADAAPLEAGRPLRTVECFAWPWDARSPFVLEVRGVRVEGGEVRIPPVLFQPRSRTRGDFVFFPWIDSRARRAPAR
jgi:hypothetical protein